jgi:hypothetical protein
LRPNALELGIQSESARPRKTKAFLHSGDLNQRDASCQSQGKRSSLPRVTGNPSARPIISVCTAKVFPEGTQGRPRKTASLILRRGRSSRRRRCVDRRIRLRLAFRGR